MSSPPKEVPESSATGSANRKRRASTNLLQPNQFLVKSPQLSPKTKRLRSDRSEKVRQVLKRPVMYNIYIKLPTADRKFLAPSTIGLLLQQIQDAEKIKLKKENKIHNLDCNTALWPSFIERWTIISTAVVFPRYADKSAFCWAGTIPATEIEQLRVIAQEVTEFLNTRDYQPESFAHNQKISKLWIELIANKAGRKGFLWFDKDRFRQAADAALNA